MTTPRRLGFLAVTLVAFGVYVAAATTGPYWLDSSEFAAQAFGLGISHPPGHPLYGMLGKLFALLPIGPVAFRVALLSACCAALGAGLLYLVALELVDRARGGDAPPGPTPVLVAVAVALTLACSYSYAFQAVRPEVYALHALCALIVLLAVLRHDRTGDRRWLYGGALAGALGLGNHHLLMLAALGPALLVAAARRPASGWRRTVVRIAGFTVLGLLVWAYLPLRAARAPQPDWGDPRTPARFLWTVSARAFSHKSLERAHDPLYAGAPGGMLALAGRQLPGLALLAPVGLVLLARRREGRRAAALVVGVAVAGAAATWLVGFDADNPDIHGYLAVPLGAVAAAAAPALVTLLALAARRGARGRVVAAAGAGALLLAPALTLVAAWSAIDLRAANGRDVVTRALLDAAPPRATLLTGYFQSAFGLWYARGVEGARPDLTHLHVTFAGFPGYAAQALRAAPDRAWLATVRGHETDAATLARLAAQGPAVVEYDISTAPDGAALLALRGTAGRVIVDPPARAAAHRAAAAGAAGYEQTLRRRIGADVSEAQTARVLLYRAYLELRFYCLTEGPGDAALAALARAAALAPGDALVRDTARRCRLPLPAAP